jgi:hypothetical protein
VQNIVDGAVQQTQDTAGQAAEQGQQAAGSATDQTVESGDQNIEKDVKRERGETERRNR